MANQRQSTRHSIDNLKASFRNVDIIVRGMHIDVQVENLSRLGIGLIARRIDFLYKGDQFLIEFPDAGIQMKSICVHCDWEDGDTSSIGAYFLSPLNEEIFINTAQ